MNFKIVRYIHSREWQDQRHAAAHNMLFSRHSAPATPHVQFARDEEGQPLASQEESRVSLFSCWRELFLLSYMYFIDTAGSQVHVRNGGTSFL